MSDKLRFGEILVRANVLERGALDRVLQEVEGQPVDLGEVLVARQHVDEETMLQTISKALNLPGINLDRVQPDQRALSLVPRELCVEHFLLPVEVERSRTGEHLHVAMANPSDVKAIKRVTRQARLRIRPLVASARAIRAAIQRHYGGPPVPGPEPVPASAPATQAGAKAASAGSAHATAAHAAAGGGGDASTDMFDFGVTDLSALADDGPTAAGPSLDPGPGFDEGGLDDDLFEHDGGAFGARAAAPQQAAHPNSGPQPSVPPPPQLGADLMSLLDSSATQSMVGQGDLAPPPTPSAPPGARRGFGMVKRPPRPPHPEPTTGRPPPVGGTPSGGLPPLPAARRPRRRTSAKAPAAPAAQPARAHRERAPEPPPALDPFATPTPAPAPTARRPSAPLPPPVRDVAAPSSAPPTPPGVVDDLDERLDLRGLLERFVDDLDEGDAQADEVIARYLDRYGQATTPPAGDEFFAALDRTLGHTRSGMGRLIVGLVRQLARRGLVDPDELLADLRDA
ncbi:MAG: hypothetical protein H6704_00935 [Myxococcales bacterium]|nr:hypothetical protein [Myxococcales bacterium]